MLIIPSTLANSDLFGIVPQPSMKLSKSSDIFVSAVFLSGSSTRNYKEKTWIKSYSIVGNDSEGAIVIKGRPHVLVAMS